MVQRRYAGRGAQLPLQFPDGHSAAEQRPTNACHPWRQSTSGGVGQGAFRGGFVGSLDPRPAVPSRTTDGEPYGRQRQAEIYALGTAGQQPETPTSNDALRAAAREALDDAAWAYVAGGAGEGDTIDANPGAFRRWRIVPRMLRDVAERYLTVEVAGLELPAPLLPAPIGLQSLFREDGTVASASAAARAGVPFVASTVARKPMEVTTAALGDTMGWFQLYWNADEAVADSFLERAASAGYEAVVVSNHGGRQVDGSLAALDALPVVAEAVGDDAAVLFNSGIRGGADVVRALALGADAAQLGRPYVYGLAVDGADGVEAVCRNYLADIDLTIALTGYVDAEAVDRDAVREVTSGR